MVISLYMTELHLEDTYFLVWNSTITSGTPGANIDEASGMSKVKKDRMAILLHFFLADL